MLKQNLFKYTKVLKNSGFPRSSYVHCTREGKALYFFLWSPAGVNFNPIYFQGRWPWPCVCWLSIVNDLKHVLTTTTHAKISQITSGSCSPGLKGAQGTNTTMRDYLLRHIHTYMCVYILSTFVSPHINGSHLCRDAEIWERPTYETLKVDPTTIPGASA